MTQSSGKKIGSYIHYQRKKRKWSIAELAEKSTLTAAYISRLEQGDYESPTIDAVSKLANAFQMPLAALLAKSKAAPPVKISLPDLPYYLHEKYFFPTEAVDDMITFMEFIQKKYQEEIMRYKQETQEYWDQQAVTTEE